MKTPLKNKKTHTHAVPYSKKSLEREQRKQVSIVTIFPPPLLAVLEDFQSGQISKGWVKQDPIFLHIKYALLTSW